MEDENITSLKVQWVTGPHQDEWDMRGDLFKGSPQGDEHKTLWELDPCPPILVRAMEDTDGRAELEKWVQDKVPHGLTDLAGGTVIARLYDGKEH